MTKRKNYKNSDWKIKTPLRKDRVFKYRLDNYYLRVHCQGVEFKLTQNQAHWLRGVLYDYINRQI